METITWHKNMYEYFHELSNRYGALLDRIDLHLINNAACKYELELALRECKYAKAWSDRVGLT